MIHRSPSATPGGRGAGAPDDSGIGSGVGLGSGDGLGVIVGASVGVGSEVGVQVGSGWPPGITPLVGKTGGSVGGGKAAMDEATARGAAVAAGAVGRGSVSYTHLDVYKRQLPLRGHLRRGH